MHVPARGGPLGRTGAQLRHLHDGFASTSGLVRRVRRYWIPIFRAPRGARGFTVFLVNARDAEPASHIQHMQKALSEIGRTDTALGAFYRRLSARIGKIKANEFATSPCRCRHHRHDWATARRRGSGCGETCWRRDCRPRASSQPFAESPCFGALNQRNSRFWRSISEYASDGNS